MKTDEIRRRYLEFFKAKGHTVVKSASLVPEDDPTVLFTPAGMNQFKDLFLGKVAVKPYSRAASAQKCFRTGDIENVGRTPRHHTFFEMMGNFSFGDYFKREAIAWAWEFITKEMKLDASRIYVSVYQDDDEAYDIWRKEIGLPDYRVTRMGEDDNFWPAGAPSKGPNGVCGPCSEIFFDWQNKYPNNKDTRPNYDDLVEFWNLVFTQYNRLDGGKLDPLPQKNIDTGMGLERMAAILQGKKSNFQIDLFEAILARLSDLLGVPYKYSSDAEFNAEPLQRMRRIADHVRAVTFAIADGARPSREGHGYVVRKILRRAVSDARALGVEKPVLFQMVPVVAEVMHTYPELKDSAVSVKQFVENEEHQYFETISKADAKFKEIIVAHQVRYEPQNHFWSNTTEGLGTSIFGLKGASVADSIPPSGYTAMGSGLFMLYDTHGIPQEQILETTIASGYAIDCVGFEKEMEAQRKRAQAGSKLKGDVFDTGYMAVIKEHFAPTEFLGYGERGGLTHAKVKVLAVVKNEQIGSPAKAGDEVIVVLNRTSFYAESGGQVGDAGILENAQCVVEVSDTRKNAGFFLHYGKVKSGILAAGSDIEAKVDEARRNATRKNHTATHLLHARLKEVLGKHVAQAGSLVCADYLRFDFTNPGAVSKEALRKIEQLVNQDVATQRDVATCEMSLEKAKAEGAVAMFGEKYGDVVRVVDVPGISKELCGGTHIDNVGKIGVLKITGETAIAAGIRRVEAVTGDRALELLFSASNVLSDLARSVGVGEHELKTKYEQMAEENRKLAKDLAKFRAEKMLAEAGKLQPRATVGSLTIYAEFLDGASADDLKSVAGQLTRKGIVLVVLAGAGGGLLLAASNDAVAAKQDANWAKTKLQDLLDFKGGGRPQMVQGRASRPFDAEQVARAFQ